MKKQLLTLAALSIFGSATVFAQHKIVNPQGPLSKQVDAQPQIQRCATQSPDAEWDQEFNAMVEKYIAEHPPVNGRQVATVYTIPVIVHIIHSGEAVGSGTNISAAQVADQIRILNEDYAGIGLNSNNVPYAFNQLKADCGVQFCLATQDESGNTLAEPGIHRVPYTSISGLSAPGANGYSTATIDGTIKPNTIWTPVKYCNMWVLKIQSDLLGYATFPLNSNNTGLSAPYGSATTDGLVMGYNYFGSIGAAASSAPYNKGRTTTHEIGHWLGLRHIWGDNGQCGASDYATDTPPQKGGTNAPAGCYYGNPTYPSQPGTCTRNDGVAGASVTNTNGDMFMNFMDYTDDASMYMFTAAQAVRIQTTMANGNYRKFLGTHGLCSSSGVAAAAPVAGFDWERTVAVTSAAVCNGVANNFRDASRNYPTSWAWSVNPSTGVTITSASSQNPTITFANAGTYTVTLTATNASGSNTKNKTITVNSCSTAAPTAAFTIASTGCTGTAVSISNTSTGNPTPTYAWSSNPSTGVSFSSTTATSPTVTFANAGTYTVSVTATNSQGNQSANHVITVSNCTLSQCDTLMNLSDTSSLVLYTVSSANGGGYVTGNNGYGDKAKAEYYTQSGITGSNLTGMLVYFFANGANGTGGNASGTLSFEVYNGNNTTGPSGAAVKTQAVTLGTIASGGIQAGTVLAYAHTYTTPYSLTANQFIAGVRLPTTTGDTAAIYSGMFDVPATNTAWELYGTTWYNLATNWNSTTASLAIFPIICPVSVGLAASELNNKISVFPNPTSGLLNIAFAIEKTDVTIDITNMLGQVVYTENAKDVSATAKTIDLSSLAKGVYMVTISTPKEKMIRKIVIE